VRVPDTRRLANGFLWVAIVLLALDGVALGQEEAVGASPVALRELAQPSDDPEEQSGILGWLRAGVSEILTRERLQVHVNGAYQDSVSRTETEISFRTYGEQSRFLARERFSGGTHVDVGGSLLVWRGLLLGASYTQVNSAGSAVVTGTVPHPLDVGRDRTTPEHTVSLPHRERATHAYLGWRLPLRDALEMELSAGASYFSLRRGVIASLIPGETGGPPFAEVTLQVDTGEHTRNGAGFNAGVDITYMLTSPAYIPQLGVGYFARVTSGFVSIPLSADSWRRETVGGIQTGIGLRLRF